MSEPTPTEFLLARIAEDEVDAEKAAQQGCGYGHWRQGTARPTDDYGAMEWDDSYEGVSEDCLDWDGAGGVVHDDGAPSLEQARHIARHDPARELAECAAKRRIVEIHEAAVDHADMCGWPCSTLCALAAVYADHPEFLESWRA